MNIQAIILSQLPLGILIIIAVVVLWFRLNDLSNEVNHFKESFERQVHWCMDHFQHKL